MFRALPGLTLFFKPPGPSPIAPRDEIGVRGFPACGYFILGRDGGGAGGREKFRVVVAVVARPGPGPGSARPPFFCFLFFVFQMSDFGILVRCA